MPYRETWVTPKVALRYKNVTVYHVYKDNNESSWPLLYYFTLDPNDRTDETDTAFDVRMLPGYSRKQSPFENLKAMIKAGVKLPVGEENL